jgi:hypothetical protein
LKGILSGNIRDSTNYELQTLQSIFDRAEGEDN